MEPFEFKHIAFLSPEPNAWLGDSLLFLPLPSLRTDPEYLTSGFVGVLWVLLLGTTSLPDCFLWPSH